MTRGPGVWAVAAATLSVGAALAIGCATGNEGNPVGAESVGAAGSAVAQAERGGKLYGENCAKCHGDQGQGTASEKGKAPPVVGASALPLDPPPGAKYRKGQFHTARDVYDFVKANMPPGMGDTLPVQEYLDIMAFDLKANGVDLTGKTITPESLQAIVLHP
jgi:polar amino acid transport system substrate-binding protein